MKNLIVFLLCILFTSCQVSRQTTTAPIEQNHTFNTTFDKTWTALVRVLSEDSYPFKIMEKSSGILQTDNMRLDEVTLEKYSTSKSAPGATFEGGTLNVKFFVRSEDSLRTVVQITTYIQGVFYVYKVFANVNEVDELQSSGVLERHLFQRIETTLESTK